MLQRLVGSQYYEGAEHFCYHQGNASCNGGGYFSHSFDIGPLHIIVELGKATEGHVSRMVLFNGIAEGFAELRLSKEGVECSMFLQGPASCSHSEVEFRIGMGIGLTESGFVPAMKAVRVCRWCGTELAEVHARLEPKNTYLGW